MYIIVNIYGEFVCVRVSVYLLCSQSTYTCSVCFKNAAT